MLLLIVTDWCSATKFPFARGFKFGILVWPYIDSSHDTLAEGEVRCQRLSLVSMDNGFPDVDVRCSRDPNHSGSHHINISRLSIFHSVPSIGNEPIVRQEYPTSRHLHGNHRPDS